MDAAGFDSILVETVGVGQAEYDVVVAADTVVVVLCPGAGDGIQAMKAGLLEVADVLVVNKKDLPGADRLVVDLEEAVHLRAFGKGAGTSQLAWIPPVVACSAKGGEGIPSVADAVRAHREHLQAKGLDSVRREKRLAQVRRAVEERLEERLWNRGGLAERARALLDSGRAPYDVVESVVSSILSPAGSAGEKAGARSEEKKTAEPKRGAKSA
jgi:LAO/AO transport system kinase